MRTPSKRQDMRGGALMLKKASHIPLIFSVFLLSLFLLFTNVNLASAQVTSDTKPSKPAPALEQILRVGLTPSLNADSDQETSTDGYREAMFRLYNKWTGEHFYTSSKSERDNIVKEGWTYEQIEWYAPTQLKTVPVYRLYNPYVAGGDHHYTTSADERDYDIKAGWKDEGIAWYSVPEDVEERVAVLRQYNPYAETGTHNYSTNQEENDYLVSIGWKAEGIGWYGYDTIEPKTQEIDFANKAVVDQADKTYTSKAITPKATLKGLAAGTDYEVTYSNNINVGTATITIKGKGNYTGSKNYSFKITPLDISTNSTVTLGDSLTYNAAEQTQTVSKVVASGITLSNSDYILSDNKQTNAGTYTLKVAGEGNFTGSIEKAFTIAKATPEVPTDLSVIARPGQTFADVPLPSLPEGFDGTIEWKTPSDSVGDEEGTVEGIVIYTPKDRENYEKVEVSVSVNVIENTYIIVFHGNGGTTSDGNDTYSQICERDKNYEFLDNAFTLSGKTFGFWGNAAQTKESDSTYVNKHEIYNFADKGATVHVYAHWMDETLGNYWLGGSRDADPGVSGSVTKNQSEIDANLRDESFWQTQMDADCRLYTIWNYDRVTNFTNRFVEFRVIQVGEHDNDGSVATFMCTHSLPSADQMKPDNAGNSGGWIESTMYQKMNSEDGYIMRGLSGLATSVRAVEKKSTTGNFTDGWTSTSSTDTFWLLSRSEISETFTTTDFRYEGSAYPWIVANGKRSSDGQTIAMDALDKNRNGDDTSDDLYDWWTRSPRIADDYEWGMVYTFFNPDISLYNGAMADNGIVPCFCF